MRDGCVGWAGRAALALVLCVLAWSGAAFAGEAPGYTFPPGGGGSGTISSGTTGYFPKYTGATTIGNSGLEDLGGGEVKYHVDGDNSTATLNWGQGWATFPHQYYLFPEVKNANLGNTVAVLAPSLSLNGGNRLAGVAVSAPVFSSGSVTTNVATINTTAAHGLTTGDVVTISSSTGVTVDGTFRVTVVDADTFTFAITVGDGTITAATIAPVAQVQIGGSVSSPPTSPISIGGATTITGSADAVQLAVKASASQSSAYVLEIQTSAGAPALVVNQSGNILSGGNSTSNSTLITSSIVQLPNATAALGGVSGLGLNSVSAITWSSNGGGGSSQTNIALGLAYVEAATLKITNGSTGGGILEFPDVASLGTVSADSARIGSIAGEMWVKDAAGNATQISPHAKGSPGYDPARDQPQDIVIQHFNAYLGKWEFVHLSRFIREYEAASGKQYIYEKPIAKSDWNADQQKLQDAYDAERAKELAAKAAYDAKPAKARAGTSAPVVREAKNVKKPCPAWMQPAQAK